ncbi:MAG: hypothetical protein U1D70_05820 [Methylobacter sp.]|nr:hypothetical protein [Methylobacter sp.]
MASDPLTIDQLRNTTYPENSLERAQQKALEDKAISTFVDAMKKFDYAESNAHKREVELEAAKLKERTGVQVRYESSFWNKGSFVFPKGMVESSVRATLVKLTAGVDALPIDGNPKKGYSIAVSDLSSAAPDLVNEAKAEQQKELLALKAAQTEAANKTLAAHGWDLTGYNHRWHKHKPPADNPVQTAAAPPKAAAATAANTVAAETHAATTYAIAEPPRVMPILQPLDAGKTVVAHALPEKTRQLSHKAQRQAQQAEAIADIRKLAEKTRLAALESANASKNTILFLSELKATSVSDDHDQKKYS